MKLSINWLKEYVDIKAPVDDVVAKIGAQIGAVEEVVDLSKKYQGIIVAKVVSCIKHPNADKLHVCLIDDGGKAKGVKRDSKGLVQVVCGAPNVREGLLVAWLPPGVTVPSSYDKDPFVLEARDLRGEVSNGMLASASELDISDDHSGILEIESGATIERTKPGPVNHLEALSSLVVTHKIKPGDDFAKKFGLDDHIIDIENKMLTHRPDGFGLLGLAREVAGIYGKPFHSPKWYLGDKTVTTGKDKNDLVIKNELPKLVPRFMSQVMWDVDIHASSVGLQTALARVGIRPINNVVDVTNYMMYLTGQPMHAYDYDKLRKLDDSKHATITVRHAKSGEKIKLLNGKEITPGPSDIMIASATKLIGVGGVMGGSETEVDEHTKNIILECASFDMYSIRRTAMRHGLFTDAVTRFTKGQSPLQNDRVLSFAVGQILCEAAGVPAETVYDLKGQLAEPSRVSVSAEFVNARLGTNLTLKDMAKLLENVEFKIMSVPANKKQLHVVAPFWRTDIEIPEDIVEEIGRLYGYDHLPLVLPKRSITPTAKDPLIEAKNKARDILLKAGANEVLSYSFVHGDLMLKTGQDPKDAYELSNAISPDLQYYRTSLLPSLLDKVHPNIKAGHDAFAIYEINPVHAKGYVDKQDGLPIEDQRLALVFAADSKKAEQDLQGAPYYHAQRYMSELLEAFDIGYVLQPAKDHQPKLGIGKTAIAPFEKARTVIVRSLDGQLLGELGEFTASTRRNLKLPDFVAGFELDMRQVMELAKPNMYQALSKFPKIEQDVTLKCSKDLAFGDLNAAFNDALLATRPDISKQYMRLVSIYQPENAEFKNVTFRVGLVSYERTLSASEVQALLDDSTTQLADLDVSKV